MRIKAASISIALLVLASLLGGPTVGAEQEYFRFAFNTYLPVELKLTLQEVTTLQFNDNQLYLKTPDFSLTIVFRALNIPLEWTLTPQAFTAKLTLPPGTFVNIGKAKVEFPEPGSGRVMHLPRTFRAQSFSVIGLYLTGDLWITLDFYPALTLTVELYQRQDRQ